MAKRTGKICPPVTGENLFVIKVPADSKTVIVISPKVDTPSIKCEKVAESDSTAVQNNRASMADALMSHIRFNSDSDSDNGSDGCEFSR